MKIDIISDIHECFWIKGRDIAKPKFKVEIALFVKEILVPGDGDVLVIAGDTGHYNNVTKALLLELKKYYKHIILTWGNHNLYLVSNSQASKYKSKSINRLEELKEICKEMGVYFLDGEVVEVEGIRFGGTGSWYNLQTKQEIYTWGKVMNDSNLIYDGCTVQSYGMYQSYSRPSNNWNPVGFYAKEKAKLDKIAEEGCDVFITHIALHEPDESEGMAEEYINQKDNIFYYTENFDLVKKAGTKIYIHGHTHQNLDYIKDGVQVICNPLGYPSDNTLNIIKQVEI